MNEVSIVSISFTYNIILQTQYIISTKKRFDNSIPSILHAVILPQQL